MYRPYLVFQNLEVGQRWNDPDSPCTVDNLLNQFDERRSAKYVTVTTYYSQHTIYCRHYTVYSVVGAASAVSSNVPYNNMGTSQLQRSKYCRLHETAWYTSCKETFSTILLLKSICMLLFSCRNLFPSIFVSGRVHFEPNAVLLENLLLHSYYC